MVYSEVFLGGFIGGKRVGSSLYESLEYDDVNFLYLYEMDGYANVMFRISFGLKIHIEVGSGLGSAVVSEV